MHEVALELRDVSKIYKLGTVQVKALDNVNLQIQTRDFVAILGPSGSGKSTLLNLLGALDRPTKGSILLEGTNLARMSDGQLSKIRRYKIGFIFQSFNLIPTLSAVENVMVPLTPVAGDGGRLRKKAEQLLETVGLAKRMHHRPTELSGGEQQRVAIARSLIGNPVIILADEPTGNVDSKTGEEIMELMTSLNREHGQTFIVVSHDPRIKNVAARVVYLRDGQIVDTLESLQDDIRSSNTSSS